MNNVDNNNKEYSLTARSIFALFGFAWLVGFVTELYQFFYGEHLGVLILISLPLLSYLLLHVAFKGKAPTWFEDKSIFGSANTETHESE